MNETFCQICRHETPGHEPGCPVETGEPVHAVLEPIQWLNAEQQQQMQGGLSQMGSANIQMISYSG